VDFALKTILWSKDTAVRLQLWDVGGQERFGHLTGAFYRGAAAAVIVFDATNPTSFNNIPKWTRDVHSKEKMMLADGSSVQLPTILLATKCDLLKPDEWHAPVPRSEMNDFCDKNGFLGWFETSAKDTSYTAAINDAFKCLIKKAMEYNTVEVNIDMCSSPPVSLSPWDFPKEAEQSKCSC